MGITVLILTLNEERHIERALRSVAHFADHCVVVDSGSDDDTVARARSLGAEVLTHPFVNQARQFNWALEQLPPETSWVFRLDADEIVSDVLAREISARLPSLSEEVVGLTVPRRIAFLRRPICHGGVFPVHILRLFRFGQGRSEDRWMDEHIVVEGQIEALGGELLDDNLHPLGWWIEKHNNYASREALQMLLNDRQVSGGFAGSPEISGQAGVKRWIKRNVYGKLPIGFRAFSYFFYRYFLCRGFLDGFPGLAFHFLQGFWYRFLVDAKLFEARRYLTEVDNDLAAASREVFGLEIDARVSIVDVDLSIEKRLQQSAE